MATVSWTAVKTWSTGFLVLPIWLIILCQAPMAPSAHAFPIDDYGSAVRITFDSAMSGNVSSTVDEDGNIHVVWEDYRSGNGDIYYVKLDPEGNKLTNDAKISNDSYSSRRPTVAVDPSDHIYVVWEDDRTGASELYFAKLWYYDGNITFQENGLRVSDSNPAASMEPCLAVNRDGNLSLAWTDARNDAGDGNLEIYFKCLLPSGASVSPDIRVTNDVGRSERPKLCVDSNNMVHLVWYDFRDSSSGTVINHGVFYRKLEPFGIAASQERRITFASPSSRPDVAVDTDGNVHVVFDDDRYASFDIFYTLLDNNGITIRDDMNISPKDDYESRYPSVSLSDSNAVDVVWQDFAPGNWEVHYSAMAYDGSLEVYDQQITEGSFVNATRPSVMCSRDNNTLVMFVGELGGGNTDLFFCRTHRPDVEVSASDVTISTTLPLVGDEVMLRALISNLEGATVASLKVALYSGTTMVDSINLTNLAAGQSAYAEFEHTAEEGETTLSILLDPDQTIRETEEWNNQVSIPVIVRVPGVSLETLANSASVEPGEDAIFQVTIENEGNVDFGIDLSASGLPEGWTISYGGEPDGHFEVASESTNSTTVRVSVPQEETPGPRVFNLTAFCLDRVSVNSTLALLVDVERVGAADIQAPIGGIVEPTIAKSFEFVLVNDANTNETFDIVAEDQRGWAIGLSASEVELEPAVPVNVTLTLIADRYDPESTTNLVTLRMISRDLGNNTAQATMLCVVGRHNEVSLAVSGQSMLNFSVPADLQIVYLVNVTNLGNCDDIIRLGGTGLTAVGGLLNTTYVFLEAGEHQDVMVIITPGRTVPAGIYAFNVTATSESAPEANDTLPMGVNILPFYDMRISIDQQMVIARAGENVCLNLTITNMGNTADAADIYLYTEAFNATKIVYEGREYDVELEIVPPIPVGMAETVTIMLNISVGEGSAAGEHELYADVSSMGDPTVSYSAPFIILVQGQESWVSIWVVAAVAAVAAVFLLLLFLYLRAKAIREQEAAAAERRKMQKKPSGAKKPSSGK